MSTQLPPLQGYEAMRGGCAQQAAAPGDAQALCQQLFNLVLSVRVPAGSTAGMLVQGTGALEVQRALPPFGSAACREAMGVGAPRHRMETAWLHGDGSARLQAAAFARARCASHRLQARCPAAGVAHYHRQPALALRHSLAAAARQAHPRRAPAARAAALLHAPRAGHQQRAGVRHGGRPPAGPLASSQPPPLPAPPLRRSPPCTGDVTAPTRTAGAPPPGAAGCQRCRAESRVTAISSAAAPNCQIGRAFV